MSDLSEGSLSQSDKGLLDNQLESAKNKRRMRYWLFGLLLVVAIAYLVSLLYMVLAAFCNPTRLSSFAGAEAHGIVLIGVVLFVMAGVPLSLAITLRKLSADSQLQPKEDDAGAQFTTAFAELVKAGKEMFRKSGD